MLHCQATAIPGWCWKHSRMAGSKVPPFLCPGTKATIERVGLHWASRDKVGEVKLACLPPVHEFPYSGHIATQVGPLGAAVIQHWHHLSLACKSHHNKTKLWTLCRSTNTLANLDWKGTNLPHLTEKNALKFTARITKCYEVDNRMQLKWQIPFLQYLWYTK